MDVQVALIAHPTDPFTEAAGQAWSTPYAERPKRTLQVEASDTLAAVLEEAARAFNLRPPEHHHFAEFTAAHIRTAFYRPEDEHGVERTYWELGALTVVDVRGHVVFGVHDARTVTMAQLARAAEAGVLGGDATRPYLIVEKPYGDAPPIDLATYREALEVIWDTVAGLSTVGGAIALGKLVIDGIRSRLRDGRDGLDAAWPELPQRVQRPDQLWHLAALRAWHTDELTRLLDLRAEVVDRLLHGAGFDPDEAGSWRVSTADDARALYDLHTIVNQTFSMYHERLAEELGERVAAWLRTGAIPPLPGEAEQEDYWGVGAARRRRARDVGDPADLVHVRVFCATTKRPALGLLADAAGARVEAEPNPSMPRPWTEGVLVGNDGSVVELKIDLDDGDPDGLFSAEIAEFIDGLMLSSDDRRYDIIRRLCSARMIAVVSFRADADQTGVRTALAIAETVAAVGEGIVHVDEPGEDGEKAFVLDGLLRTT